MLNSLEKYIQGLLLELPSHKRIPIFEFYNLSHIPLKHDDFKSLYFLRGLIEMNGDIIYPKDSSEPIFQLHLGNKSLLHTIQDNFCNIPSTLTEYVLSFKGCNMVDFLGDIYYNTEIKKPYIQNDILNKFQECLRNVSPFSVCGFKVEHPSAVIPFKSRFSDVGYDLTIIRVSKKYTSNTTLYDTGISLSIPFGYYAEIVPRSSLSKTGYMLANSVGIIDNSYRGNLYIPLTKICSDSPDIDLPFRCCQLIFKKQEFVWMKENVETHETSRGIRGFGSTNIR